MRGAFGWLTDPKTDEQLAAEEAERERETAEWEAAIQARMRRQFPFLFPPQRPSIDNDAAFEAEYDAARDEFSGVTGALSPVIPELTKRGVLNQPEPEPEVALEPEPEPVPEPKPESAMPEPPRTFVRLSDGSTSMADVDGPSWGPRPGSAVRLFG